MAFILPTNQDVLPVKCLASSFCQTTLETLGSRIVVPTGGKIFLLIILKISVKAVYQPRQSVSAIRGLRCITQTDPASVLSEAAVNLLLFSIYAVIVWGHKSKCAILTYVKGVSTFIFSQPLSEPTWTCGLNKCSRDSASKPVSILTVPSTYTGPGRTRDLKARHFPSVFSLFGPTWH